LYGAIPKQAIGVLPLPFFQFIIKLESKLMAEKMEERTFRQQVRMVLLLDEFKSFPRKVIATFGRS
jgi:hypothetical protein